MTPDPSPDAADPSPDRAREGLEHLQAAGRELVAAARAALDVVEEVIDDPDTLKSVTGAVGSVGEMLREAAARLLSGRGDGTHGETTDGPEVERIPVD